MQLPRLTPLGALALAVPGIWFAPPGFAQAPSESNDGAAWSAFISPAYQFDADTDGGNELQVDRLSLGISRQGSIGSRFRSNIALQYEFQDWEFGNAGAFGGTGPWDEPWDELHRVTVSARIARPLNNGWEISGGPIVEFAGEDGASTGDSLVYGGMVSAVRRISPDLTLGFGATVKREIEKTRISPILIVSWQINDRLWLRNALPNAPTGPAGLELAYRVTDQWEFAGGGGFRRVRFRLDEDGPSAGGVGESRSFPVFARATRALGESAALSIYAGAVLGGELRLDDAEDERLDEDDYDPAPIVALALSRRF